MQQMRRVDQDLKALQERVSLLSKKEAKEMEK